LSIGYALVTPGEGWQPSAEVMADLKRVRGARKERSSLSWTPVS
jgi:hypothetical protein